MATWLPISGAVVQRVLSSGKPASGYILKLYDAGTTTNTPLATSSAGTTTATYAVYNSLGDLTVSGTPIIPHIDRDYKLAIYPSLEAASADTGAVLTIDNVEQGGGLGALRADLLSTVDDKGSELVGYKQHALAGSVARTVYDKLSDTVHIKDFGGAGDNSTDDSAAILAAITALTRAGTATGGGAIIFGSGIYISAPFSLPDRVSLIGDSRGSTILKLKSGSNADFITIPVTTNLFTISQLTIDGNKANNTAGTGLIFADASAASGYSGAPYNDKTVAASGQFAYKQANIYDVAVGNCATDGVYIGPRNYQTFFDNFSVSHNVRDGFSCFASDCLFSNFYSEKNGRIGVWASGSNNKYSNVKSIWNGQTDATMGGFRDQGTKNLYLNCESQDNYCDGWLVLGTESMFISCDGNTNGYLAVGSEDQSNETSSNWVFGSPATKIFLIARSGTYKTAVGTDALWTTQYPYYINTPGADQFLFFSMDYDQSKFNAQPNFILEVLCQNTELGNLYLISSDADNTFLEVSPKSPTGTGDKTVRLFRDTETSGDSVVHIYDPGTADVQHQMNATTGDAQFSILGGITSIGHATTGGAWNTGHMKLGPYHLWVDSTGDLRIKSTTPSSDTDGAVVGAQT